MTTNISIRNPADHKQTPLECIPSSTCWRTLGVLLSPEGHGCTQSIFLLQRAKEFLGKFRNTNISPRARWLAITTVIEPAVLYPLLNTSYSH